MEELTQNVRDYLPLLDNFFISYGETSPIVTSLRKLQEETSVSSLREFVNTIISTLSGKIPDNFISTFIDLALNAGYKAIALEDGAYMSLSKKSLLNLSESGSDWSLLTIDNSKLKELGQSLLKSSQEANLARWTAKLAGMLANDDPKKEEFFKAVGYSTDFVDRAKQHLGNSGVLDSLFFYMDVGSGKTYSLDDIMAGKVPNSSKFMRHSGLSYTQPKPVQVVNVATIVNPSFEIRRQVLQLFGIPLLQHRIYRPVFHEVDEEGYGSGLITQTLSKEVLTFQQAYQQIQPDRALVELAATMELLEPKYEGIQQKIITTMEKSYCGNGNIIATVSRLAKVLRNAASLRKGPGWINGSPGRWLGTNGPLFKKTIWTRMGIRVPKLEVTFSLETLPTVINLMAKAVGHAVYPLNANASPGLIFAPNETQGSRVRADFVMAQKYLSVIKEQGWKALFQIYPHLRVVPIKAKFEVNPITGDGKPPPQFTIGDKTVLEVKARNYYPVEKDASLVAQILYKASHSNIENAQLTIHKDDEERCWSLLGQKMWRGELSKFIYTIIGSRRPFMAAYSDNLYLYTPVKDKKGVAKYCWVSLDGVKMESGASFADYAMYNRYLLEQWGFNVSQEIKDYFMEVHPRLSVNLEGLLGDSLVYVPGQVSGASGTAQCNTTMSLAVMMEMNKYPTRPIIELASTWTEVEAMVAKRENIAGKFTFSQHMVESMKLGGSNFTIESVVPLMYFSGQHGPIPLDYLGYDMVKLSKGQHFVDASVPILQRDRLLRAIVNDKTSEPGLKKAVPSIERWMTLWVLYLIGGWYYDDLAILIKNRMAQLKKSILDSNYTPEIIAERFETAQKTVEEALPGLNDIDFLTSRIWLDPAPSYASVMSLLLSPAKFTEWVVNSSVLITNQQKFLSMYGLSTKRETLEQVASLVPELKGFSETVMTTQEANALGINLVEVKDFVEFLENITAKPVLESLANKDEQLTNEQMEKDWSYEPTKNAEKPVEKMTIPQAVKGKNVKVDEKLFKAFIENTMNGKKAYLVQIRPEDVKKFPGPKMQSHLFNLYIAKISTMFGTTPPAIENMFAKFVTMEALLNNVLLIPHTKSLPSILESPLVGNIPAYFKVPIEETEADIPFVQKRLAERTGLTPFNNGQIPLIYSPKALGTTYPFGYISNSKIGHKLEEGNIAYYASKQADVRKHMGKEKVTVDPQAVYHMLFYLAYRNIYNEHETEKSLLALREEISRFFISSLWAMIEPFSFMATKLWHITTLYDRSYMEKVFLLPKLPPKVEWDSQNEENINESVKYIIKVWIETFDKAFDFDEFFREYEENIIHEGLLDVLQVWHKTTEERNQWHDTRLAREQFHAKIMAEIEKDKKDAENNIPTTKGMDQASLETPSSNTDGKEKEKYVKVVPEGSTLPSTASYASEVRVAGIKERQRKKTLQVNTPSVQVTVPQPLTEKKTGPKKVTAKPTPTSTGNGPFSRPEREVNVQTEQEEGEPLARNNVLGVRYKKKAGVSHIN